MFPAQLWILCEESNGPPIKTEYQAGTRHSKYKKKPLIVSTSAELNIREYFKFTNNFGKSTSCPFVLYKICTSRWAHNLKASYTESCSKHSVYSDRWKVYLPSVCFIKKYMYFGVSPQLKSIVYEIVFQTFGLFL